MTTQDKYQIDQQALDNLRLMNPPRRKFQVDQRCHDLAVIFLPDGTARNLCEKQQELAIAIQETIEDFLSNL